MSMLENNAVCLESLLFPYHLFERSGERFVHFLERGCAFRIDETTHALLTRARAVSLKEAAAELLHAGLEPPEMIQEALSEALLLGRAGFYKPVSNTLSSERIEQALEHRYTTPWTRLELALAETCNLACKYCYCSAVRDMPNNGLMSETVARQAIDWLIRVSQNEKELGIVLFGGEPLLNKPVFQFVMEYSHARAQETGKQVRYSMTTNGTLLDDMAIHYIKKHDFALMVSLDGPPISMMHNARRRAGSHRLRWRPRALSA